MAHLLQTGSREEKAILYILPKIAPVEFELPFAVIGRDWAYNGTDTERKIKTTAVS